MPERDEQEPIWVTFGPSDSVTVRRSREDAENWAALGQDRGRKAAMILTPEQVERIVAARIAADTTEGGQ